MNNGFLFRMRFWIAKTIGEFFIRFAEPEKYEKWNKGRGHGKE